MDATFEDVVKLAEQLSPEEQNLLIYRLRVKQAVEETSQPPLREKLLREVEILRQTPVNPDHRLLGKYANPDIQEMSEEEFHAQMHAISTEWEQELDEFTNDEP